MRCLALAQAWQSRGGRAVFAVSTITPALEARLHSERFEIVRLSAAQGFIEDANEASQLALKRGASWIVVDGYHFGSEYQKIVKESGMHLLFVDDCGHADRYYADLVLNQNLHARESLYKSRESYTNLLLGTTYALIRREFLEWVGRKSNVPKIAGKVLVTMGGSDPENMTLKVIQALNSVEIPGLTALIVAGGSNLHYEDLRSEVEKSVHEIVLKKDVQNMPELMAWADIAIASGGSSIWELALMGVPIIGLARARQEFQLLERTTKCGITISLGYYKYIDIDKISKTFARLAADKIMRLEMSKIGRSMIDGLGPARIIRSMKEV
jgi:UDP-2,4-diacetamido-2,4,6-trideoxy-beta-L-altropyranose hydrolase